jgi:WD40 repeat protein
MCSDPEELRQRTGWDGASGSSRTQLLSDLQCACFCVQFHVPRSILIFLVDYIPPSIMIPQRRLATLLRQAREYQHSRCVYHNSPLETSTFSLYTDHHCNKSDFPNTTTTILRGHSDEVWNMQWSHDAMYLATCGKDRTTIIWKTGVSPESSVLAFTQHFS